MSGEERSLTLRDVGGDLTQFDPVQTRPRLANLDGDIVRFRAIRDWPKLGEAVDAKIAEQAAFVTNWDARVRPQGHQPNNADVHYLSVSDALDLWGFRQDTVSRWRTSLRDAPAYRTKILLGTYRLAGLGEDEEGSETGDEWCTPQEWIDLARDVMGGIELDPATNEAAQSRVQAERYFIAEDDGLAHRWEAASLWLNPPYSRDLIGRFAQKLLDEVAAGHTKQAVVLVNAMSSSEWFQDLCRAADIVCLLNTRINFLNPDGTVAKGAPPVGQALFYLGHEEGFGRFQNACETKGVMMMSTDVLNREIDPEIDAEIDAGEAQAGDGSVDRSLA